MNPTELDLSFTPSEAFLLKLPKTDLHVHLDGSVRLKTILELAERYKVDLPGNDEESLARAIHMGETCDRQFIIKDGAYPFIKNTLLQHPG